METEIENSTPSSPICQKAGCPRYGRPLTRHGLYRPSNGRNLKLQGRYPSARIVRFLCNPGRPHRCHYIYRGPDGELAETTRALMARFDTRPECSKEDCPQYGEKMWRGRSRLFQVKNGSGKVTITLFVCNPHRSADRPHYAYQGPNGEVAVRILPDGQLGNDDQNWTGKYGGYFRFTDSVTGQIVETEFNPEGVVRLLEAVRRPYKGTERARRVGQMMKAFLKSDEARRRWGEISKNNWARRNAQITRERAELAELKEKMRRISKGRQREDELRRRVHECRTIGLTWPETKTLLDQEFDQTRSLDAYRGYMRNPKPIRPQ